MHNKWIRCLVFAIIFALIFIPASDLFVKAGNRTYVYQREFFYGQQQNSIDIIYIGGSTILTGIQPAVIWNESNITGFNCAISGPLPFSLYYLLKEALETQSPAVVVLDAQILLNRRDVDDSYAEPYLRIALHTIADKRVRREAVNELAQISKKSAFYIHLSFLFPYIRYCLNWNEMGPLGVVRLLQGETTRMKKSHMGAIVYTGYEGENHFDASFMDKSDLNVEYTDFSYEYYKRMFELCKNKNINLVMLSMPHPGWSYEKHNTVQEICDENDILFFDLNLFLSEMEIDPSKDFFNKSHLNITGANKVSVFLSDILSSMIAEGAGADESVREVWDETWVDFSKEYQSYYDNESE